MSTIKISLPKTLEAFVEQQVSERGYRTSSEYVCDLICQAKDCQILRSLLRDGASSPPTPVVDETYFADLRELASQTLPSHP